MPGGHKHYPINSLRIYARFSGQFCNGKKDRCAVFESNNDDQFPEKYTMKFSFLPKKRA